MRLSLVTCFAVLLFSCNSSDKEKKEQPASTVQDSSANKTTTEQKQSEAIRIMPVTIATADIPPTLKFKGKVKQAWQWTDKLGDNILITSVVAPHDVKDEDGNEAQTAEVYASHYVKKDGDYNLLWQINDAVKECPLDMFCDFINGSDNVTDLDNNGIAETKVQYATSCHGDVSPSYMKLIMHEGTIKYSLRGNRWIKDSDQARFDVTSDNVNLETLPGYNKEKDEWSEKTFGRYETEKEFAGAPAAFLVYARSEWLKFAKEQDQ
jgi:hypothetical protein